MDVSGVALTCAPRPQHQNLWHLWHCCSAEHLTFNVCWCSIWIHLGDLQCCSGISGCDMPAFFDTFIKLCNILVSRCHWRSLVLSLQDVGCNTVQPCNFMSLCCVKSFARYTPVRECRGPPTSRSLLLSRPRQPRPFKVFRRRAKAHGARCRENQMFIQGYIAMQGSC